jgi:hypothetical protein
MRAPFDLGNSTGDRAVDSLIQNLESAGEKQVSDAILKGLPDNMVSVMLNYRHGSAEVEPSEMEEGQACNKKSANNGLKLAAAVDVPSQHLAISTSPNNSPSLPKARRVRNITGTSLGSNKTNDRPIDDAKKDSAAAGKHIQPLPLDNRQKKSTGYNLAQLADCLMEEQRGGLRHKLEMNKGNGDRRDETASVTAAELARRPPLNKDCTAREPKTETNSSILFKNVALLFLKESKRPEEEETLEHEVQPKLNDNDIHHKAAVRR